MFLAEYLSQFESGFNVFSYLTLRGILAASTALGGVPIKVVTPPMVAA